MIPINEPFFAGREKELLLECIDSGWLSSEGPFVRKFEQAFAEYLGVRHAVAVCNGTAALELAVAALNLPPGSQVIIPTFTIISCALAVIRNGLIPVLVDVDPQTWTMDPEQVRAKVISNREIKAVMPVHMYGHPCDMAPLRSIAEEFDLRILEDAAEVHGAEYLLPTSASDGSAHGGQAGWRRCGSLGDLAVFSFYANKIITTGEGGMVVTDDDGLAERACLLRNLAFEPGQRFYHSLPGYNFRMTNMQAAIGVAQMEQIADLITRKRWQGEAYRQELAELAGITLQTVRDWARPVYWVNGIVIDDAVPFDAVALAKRLQEKQIQTRPFFWPMHEQPLFKKMGLFANERHPVSERLARRGLYLPSGMALTEEQLETVCASLHACL